MLHGILIRAPPCWFDRFTPVGPRYAASTIMSITYGKVTPTAYGDPEVVAVTRVLDRLTRALLPGAYLVDTYPILKYVPGYLSELKKWHREEIALYQRQLDVVREQMVNKILTGLSPEADLDQRRGNARPCFAKFLIENQAQYGLRDEEVAHVAGAIFEAGADTVSVDHDRLMAWSIVKWI